MKLQRIAIPVFIALLAMLVTFVARTLWLDLQALSTAGNENAQWTIFQLDTEFANLHSTLLEQTADPDVDLEEIRLRTDIALSRITVVGSGVSGEIIAGDERARVLLTDIRAYADQAAQLIDGALGAEDLERLVNLTAEASPLARSLALRGVQIGAARTEARRREFATQLRNTGLVAILVIAALAAAMVVLNRLLLNARQKDRELRASSKRLESTISGSLDAIVTSDRHGKILDFNPAAEKIFDWRKKDLAGLNVSILLPNWAPPITSQESEDATNAFGRYLGQGRVEIMARRRTGLVFPADLTVTTAGDSSDDLIIVYLRDISDQKINEQALVDAKERAERTDRAKSQFLTFMSHEMRTPLNGVLGVLELLRTTKTTDRQRRYLDVAVASSEVLLRQLHEALDITRIETGALKLTSQRFNLSREVSRVASVLEPLASEKNIALTLTIDPAMHIDFVADRDRIGQIVTNLVGNAIKFTSEGSVEVTLGGIHTPTVTSATVTVRDTGIGIPEDQIEAIFEDFVALSKSSGRMSRSDGLGLSISRKTARLMGGDIRASSVQGQGSEFTLSLPLERAEVTGKPAEITTQMADGKAASNILIVEDNTINRTVLRDMLTDMGHQVEVAIDGNDGLKIAEDTAFDLIFMDINMPGIDGIELTKALRAGDSINRATRIHGLTAYGKEEYLELAQAAGMNGFSTKPIRMQDLASILNDTSAGRPAEIRDHGDVDRSILRELLDALGDTRVTENLHRFVDEAEGALTEIGTMVLPDDHDAIDAALHRMSGGAALFGLRFFIEGIEKSRAHLTSDAPGNLGGLRSDLSGLVDETRTLVSSIVAELQTQRAS